MSLKRRARHARRRLTKELVRWIGGPILKALSRTWRMEVLGAENLQQSIEGGQGCFLALWHGRMVLGLPYHEGRDWYVLVSESQDGDISRALLGRFGYRVIRGSSSRGGRSAVRKMLTALRGGAVMIVTPDGPRGPRHSMNPGLTWMARGTGYPIVPIGFACDRAWRARSWDRFTLPRPWARVVMLYGAPVRIDPSASEDELEAAADRVRESLVQLERTGFERLRRDPDW